MLPSSSDRHAWWPVALITAVLLILAVLAGAGPWMLAHVAPLFNDFLESLALIFGLSSTVHAILLFPAYLLHRLLTRLTGLDVG